MPDDGEHLFRPTSYDEDARSVDSGHQVGSRADNSVSGETPKNSGELRDFDAGVLREEDERQKLLAGDREPKSHRNGRKSNGLFSRFGPAGSHQRRHEGHRRAGSGHGSTGSLMFEIEDGFKDDSSTASTASFQIRHEKGNQRSFKGRWLVLMMSIALIFVGLAFGAYSASGRYRHFKNTHTASNGSHVFAPTTIVLSLDGFRADFLNRGLTPALNSFIASGVSPRYMLPSFPSVTFPNHFTLVTGLYPESHGVVGNSFWDPDLGEEFFYTDPLRSMQPKWWNAEPLWATAEKFGVRTAVHMWPGSEAGIIPEATYIDKFNDSESLPKKVDRILQLIDLPGDLDSSKSLSSERRPQLIAAYVPNVDADGHKYGPNSTEIRTTIADADSMVALLIGGLHERNLTQIVNVVVVSDHGMATTSIERVIQLDDIINLDLVDHIDGWPLRGLRLKNPSRDVPILYEQLLQASKISDGFDVYTLENMPERFHFTHNKRIAPLWVVPKTGWAIAERAGFDVAKAKASGETYHPKGIHGYDHEHPLMRAIFLARGPAFPHAANSRVAVFQNIEVYNIICDSLSIPPHPNNGTLRLPLKVEGLHDAKGPELETPHDPPGPPADEIRPGHMQRPGQGPPPRVTEADTPKVEATELPAPEEDGKSDSESEDSWWASIQGQIEKAKEWAKHLLEKIKGSPPADDGGSFPS